VLGRREILRRRNDTGEGEMRPGKRSGRVNEKHCGRETSHQDGGFY